MDRLRFATELLNLAIELQEKELEYKSVCRDLAKKILGNSERIFETREEIEEKALKLLSEHNAISDLYDIKIKDIVQKEFEE